MEGVYLYNHIQVMMISRACKNCPYNSSPFHNRGVNHNPPLSCFLATYASIHSKTHLSVCNQAQATSLNMREVTAPAQGSKGSNTSGLFSFDGASLDNFALRKSQPPQQQRKVFPSGNPPPSSLSAKLHRKPGSVLAAALDAGQPRADGEGSIASPQQPRTALERALGPAGLLPQNGGGGGFGGKLSNSYEEPLEEKVESKEDAVALQSNNQGPAASPPSPPTKRKVTNMEALLAAEKATGEGASSADASGHFANLLLLSDLRTAEDGAQYFLKRQSHKFPVKFLHLVHSDPGYSGYKPYDMEVVPQVYMCKIHACWGVNGNNGFQLMILFFSTHSTHDSPFVLLSCFSFLQAFAESQQTYAVMTATGVTVLTRMTAADIEEGDSSQPKGSLKTAKGGPRFIASDTIQLGEWLTERNCFNIIRERLVGKKTWIGKCLSLLAFVLLPHHRSF